LIGPHPLFWLTWGCFFLTTLIGLSIRRNATWPKIFAGSLTGSLLFFVLTNLGVFLFQEMYPRNLAGLVECYVMALPFLRNTLTGDLLYTALFFSIFLLGKSLLPSRAVPSAERG